MKILIVSATRYESAPIMEQLKDLRHDGRVSTGTYNDHELHFLVTGVGMTATAYYTGKILNDSYDLAINAGVCGSFNRNLEIGTVVNVYEDQFSELGAEDGDSFLKIGRASCRERV